MQTRSKFGVHKPHYILNISHAILPTVPTCFSKSVADPKWKTVMVKEYNALIQNRTWDLIPPDPTKNLVGCKWVFKVKENYDGSIECYKAWLVAQGFKQQSGIYYDETFSPTIKSVIICIILSHALSSNWIIKQLDVKNDFLHCYLHEDVYKRQPPDYSHPDFLDHICQLQKALFGLKQEPHAWFHHFSSFLIRMGFIASSLIPSLFIYKSTKGIIYLVLYVDDIIIRGD